MTRADREFLPSALEILERPPSPIALALLSGICAFAAAAVAWAWIGMTDIVAVGHGKVQPTGKVKVVQPLETGKVRAIRAVNGTLVGEGEVLVELDPDEALAEARAAEASYVSWAAEALRRADAIAAAAADPVVDRATPWPDAIPAPIRAREDAVRLADIRRLAGDLAALDAQAAQKTAERQRILDTMAAQEMLIATQQERLDMRSSLLSSSSGTKASVIDAAESLNYQRTVLVGQRGQLAEAERALGTIATERDKTLRAFVAENAWKRAEAQRQADEAEQRVARARTRLERMTLRSPAAGAVQASVVTSLGQVLVVGQEVMRVVPQDASLEVEVYMENKDIGFVEEGQAAAVKIEAFPFTRYGVLEATVLRVGKDAIPEPDARQAEGDPTRPTDARTATGADRVRNLVFPVVLRTAKTHILADGRAVPLSPGMAVTAEIKTGQRRILDYLLSPLSAATSEALRER
ncbi:MAG: HlyD family type I secretion periplasmic adaptor subunit [Alsobacter sp.]